MNIAKVIAFLRAEQTCHDLLVAHGLIPPPPARPLAERRALIDAALARSAREG